MEEKNKKIGEKVGKDRIIEKMKESGKSEEKVVERKDKNLEKEGEKKTKKSWWARRKEKKLEGKMGKTVGNGGRSDLFAQPKNRIIASFLVGLIFALGAFVIYSNYIVSFISFGAFFVLTIIYFVVNTKLKLAGDIRKMENVFPDFIGLMASNLRAGMTVDRALLMSSRKEFAPLDKEILRLGKDIVTGKEMTLALAETGERIGSDKIKKTIKLIISGIKSGGDLAVLLEQTAKNMRERNFVEKRSASNVLMYVIFIFFAVAVGSPILFGLSSVLVGILTGILGDLPANSGGSVGLPFTFSEVSVPISFIFYFSIVFILVTDVLASLMLGLVGKGREREGAKYIIPLVLISLTVFLGSRFLLGRYFTDFFG